MRSGSGNTANSRKGTTKILIGLLIIVVITAFSACGAGGGGEDDGKGGGFLKKSEEPVDISILCVGDVMAHSTNITAALSAGSLTISLSGLAVGALTGILLNAVLPGKDYVFAEDDATALPK